MSNEQKNLGNKFGAKSSYFDGHYFASKLELDAYKAILIAFPDFKIVPQYRIRIKPKTEKYPAIFWRSDFGVFDLDDNLIAIFEAKGQVTRDFKLLMKFCEYLEPQVFRKIRLIVSRYSDRKNERSYKSLGIPILSLDEDITKKLILSLNPSYRTKTTIINSQKKRKK